LFTRAQNLVLNVVELRKPGCCNKQLGIAVKIQYVMKAILAVTIPVIVATVFQHLFLAQKSNIQASLVLIITQYAGSTFTSQIQGK